MESKQLPDWKDSTILKNIRDYNEDDCKSTLQLLQWLRKVIAENNIIANFTATSSEAPTTEKELSPQVIARLENIARLRTHTDPFSIALADLTDFHRREEKPVWWRMFDRAQATSDELLDDSECVAGIQADGSPRPEKQSQIQAYRFNPSQECKLAASDKTTVMFSHNL